MQPQSSHRVGSVHCGVAWVWGAVGPTLPARNGWDSRMWGVGAQNHNHNHVTCGAIALSPTDPDLNQNDQ